MVKTLSKVLYHGTKILVSTVRKSIQQEIELSREMAKIRYQTRNSEVEKSCDKMSLEEAQRVLNVSVLDPKEVEERYRHLFAINKGFRYLQSKVFRAKEVIDHELLNRQEILSEKPNNRQHVERKGKYLFFTYFVTSDKSHPAL